MAHDPHGPLDIKGEIERLMTRPRRERVHYAGLLAYTIQKLLNVEAPPAAFEGADADQHQQNAAYGVHQLAVFLAGDRQVYRVLIAPADAPISIGGVPADSHFAKPLREPGQ